MEGCWKLLIENKADIHVVAEDGTTPLLAAAAYLQYAKDLLKLGKTFCLFCSIFCIRYRPSTIAVKW